ncbi:60S acidic ribosomal protein P1 [Paramyrothecium foliicola]|nr:60S acidic ribosomal protein P1 [Paramyrothecium foliicola]
MIGQFLWFGLAWRYFDLRIKPTANLSVQPFPPQQPALDNSFTMSRAELASSYAALILADDGVEITSDKLQSLIKAAKIEDVEPIWTSLFAKALEGKDVKELLTNVGSGGGAAAPAGGAPAAAAGGDAAPAAEEKKEEEKDESDDDMGFGLFD